MTAGVPGLLAELREVVGPAHVIDDPEVTASYVVDWTGRFQGPPGPVVRPATVAEVAEVVRCCRRYEVALVPQGGNTGMVGGGVPLAGELVVSLRRLDAVDPVDRAAGQVTAGAGATLGQVRRAVEAAGWSYGVDFAARDSATVGGNVATNAGGLRVLRYGDTRAQVLGVEAVLGTGQPVAHLGGLLKDNTGYALPSLLCGSEGTLGVVTAARLRLVPPAPERVVALLGFGTAAAAVDAAAELRRGLPELSAAELMLEAGLGLVCRFTGAAAPFPDPHPAYLLVEAAGPVDPSDRLAAAAEALTGVVDVAVAGDPARAAALWRYREAHTEAVNAEGPPHKLDVTLPAAVLAEFVDRVPGVVAAQAPTARTWLFGHVADGNVHVNVTGLDPADERVDDAVLRLVAGYGGSISAEHGIGTAKRRWLHLNRSPAEIEAFRALKRALDPDGICNPNVLLPPA
ncbi:MAG TPA: FAD-binding oxidoreductase [Acidimicrobiales bacterium]|nr:FAD-binding oxidoreductase [Acidimicrobiales bacterium]